jgi:hypothetical protein
MENWRKFVAETERTKNYGDLYLFENDSVQKVSFYDRFSTLNENDDDFELFLEQWEKSVDYMLNNLSEQEENYTATLQAGTQAFMLLQRGGAAVGKVMNFAKKLKDKGNLGKVGGVMLLALAAGAAAVAINSLIVAGADPAEFQQAMAQVADAVGAIDPSVGQAVEQVAQNPEAALEVMPQLDQAVEQSAQQLSQVDNEAVQQMAQEVEKVSQQIDPEGEGAREQMAQWMDDALSGNHPDPPASDEELRDLQRKKYGYGAQDPMDVFMDIMGEDGEHFADELKQQIESQFDLQSMNSQEIEKVAVQAKEVAQIEDPNKAYSSWRDALWRDGPYGPGESDPFGGALARKGTEIEFGVPLTKQNIKDIISQTDFEQIAGRSAPAGETGERGLETYADFWGMDEKETKLFKRLAKRKLRSTTSGTARASAGGPDVSGYSADELEDFFRN